MNINEINYKLINYEKSNLPIIIKHTLYQHNECTKME